MRILEGFLSKIRKTRKYRWSNLRLLLRDALNFRLKESFILEGFPSNLP